MATLIAKLYQIGYQFYQDDVAVNYDKVSLSMLTNYLAVTCTNNRLEIISLNENDYEGFNSEEYNYAIFRERVNHALITLHQRQLSELVSELRSSPPIHQFADGMGEHFRELNKEYQKDGKTSYPFSVITGLERSENYENHLMLLYADKKIPSEVMAEVAEVFNDEMQKYYDNLAFSSVSNTIS